jgi:hypothetical protein
MGFFKKIFKGVGKVFKKIGKGIKKVAMKVGKFMNKIGIVGQIAMAFILPGIGAALMNGLGGMATSMIANTFGGIGGAIVRGAGHVLNAAHKFVTVGKNVFTTVTEGVAKFVGEFGKTALNKIPGINIQSASKNFFGGGGAWQTVQEDIVKNASSIMNPFKSSIKITDGMSIDDIVGSTGTSVEQIQSMNINTDLTKLKSGTSLNFDAGSMGPNQGMMTGKVADGAVDSGGKLVGDYTTNRLEDISINYGLDPTLGDVTPEKALELMKQQVPIPPNQTSLLNPDVTDLSPKSFGQKMYQGAKDEIAQRYPAATPISSALRAVGDVQDVAAEFSGPIDYSDSGYPSAPMYMASSAQDFDVRAQSTPRNFNAFSGGGQFGSQARVYDSILMSPVSTLSRDLSSRFA